jgi:hypothetical protein
VVAGESTEGQVLVESGHALALLRCLLLRVTRTSLRPSSASADLSDDDRDRSLSIPSGYARGREKFLIWDPPPKQTSRCRYWGGYIALT